MKYNIIIVGCGGTGANYIVELGRYLYQNPVSCMCSLLLIDGDVVKRQIYQDSHFLLSISGEKKAEVMSEILQEAFGVESRFYPEYLLSHNELSSLVSEDIMTIVIGAVIIMPAERFCISISL